MLITKFKRILLVVKFIIYMFQDNMRNKTDFSVTVNPLHVCLLYLCFSVVAFYYIIMSFCIYVDISICNEFRGCE